LKSPSGETISLHNRQGGSQNNLQKSYGKDALHTLIGQPAKGTWSLHVKDSAAKDQGTLNAWEVEVVCDGESNPSETFIPDNDVNGLSSQQECRYAGRVTDIQVKVDIEHPYVGDLAVSLVAPSGDTVMLHNRTGGHESHLQKTYQGDILKEMIGQQAKGQWKLIAKDFAARDNGRLRHWKVDLKIEPVDDLKKIEGIGPKIEQLLNGGGIYSFSTLSVSPDSLLKTILQGGGERFKMHNPQTWPQQAQLAAEGRWEELKVLQDELDGGKVV